MCSKGEKMNSLDALIRARNCRPRLLIVDDQAVHIRVLHELFKDECEIFMATDGAKAIELASTINPDLVLLDIVMPEMDGYEVCLKLKDKELLQDVPVIFLTAQYTPEVEQHCFQCGAADFIQKPFNAAVVLARVNNQLQLKLQNDFLQQMAYMDGLTGVANRRLFDAALSKSWLLCARMCRSMVVLVADIDHFKLYNDNFGHAVGDECLKLVANTIKSRCRRPDDLVARYGGEEFACILPDTDFSGGMHVAEDMLQAVRDIAGLPSRQDTTSHVSMSIGLAACVPGSEISLASFVGAADQQLYQAKKTGRDRVCGAIL
jgi:diguanylate cyclase (GGDEF)-like protein